MVKKKTKKENRIRLVFEFYHTGKRKLPRVNCFEGVEYQGIPEGEGFEVFYKAAHEYCRWLIKNKEFKK